MSASTSEDYLAIITQLMAEKDRLITEKDELVVSKDRLWREMHQIIQEKNERIEQLFARWTTDKDRPENDWEAQGLRAEVLHLERRNRDLEKALRDAVETDEESGGNSMDTNSFSALAHLSSDGITK
jgi:HD superfamily phosphohydrolase